MNIRQLAANVTSSIAACGEFERIVHVWDISAPQQIAVLDTSLDFGGCRLVITSDANYCITGSYSDGGVSAYSVSSRTSVWHRKDLRKMQYLRLSNWDSLVYCCFDQKPCHVLDIQSGETMAKWTGVRSVWESPYERLLFLEKRQLALQSIDTTEVIPISRETFAVLDVAFARGTVCISESGGPVRCLNTQTGKEIWRYAEKEHHVLKLAYTEAVNSYFGVCWPYKNGGLHKLVRFEKDTGKVAEVTVLEDSCDFAFCSRGSRLLLTDGSVLDVVTGKRESIISFRNVKAYN